MHENDISQQIINCSIQVHKNLGPGLLESAYEECLAYELKKQDLIRQKPLPLIYEEISMDIGYRVDLFVQEKVIVELKAVESLTNVHMAQLLTYLRLSKCKLGLLINFNVALLKDGVKRMVNGL